LVKHATKEARPRMRVMAPSFSEANIYEKIVLEMYEYGVFEWPKSVGTKRGKANYISYFKPLNDAMLALALASATGVILLRDEPGQTIAAYTDRNSMPRTKLRGLKKILNGYVNIGKGTTLQGHISIDAQMARI